MKGMILFAWAVTASSVLAAPPKPAVTWDASPNYTASSRETSYNIDAIVIHTTEGTYSGAISWFNNPSAGVSAHYVISPTGAITQMVADDDIAWHATYYNTRSIGIECAGYAGKSSTWTPELLESLTALVAYLCAEYDVPAVHPPGDAYDASDDKFKSTGIVGHNQIQPWNRSDPGAYFPWAAFIEDVSALLDVGPPAAPSIVSPSTGSTVTSSPVFLDWTAVSGIDYYQLKVFTTTGTLVHTSWPTSSSASVSLASGSYVWHVWSHNGAGFSDTSASAGLTVALPKAPSPPTGLLPASGSSITASSVTLDWAAVSGATNYEVWLEYQDAGVWKYYYAWTTGTASYKTVWPTMSKRWYRFRVRAKNSAGWGAWSGWSTFYYTNPTKS